MTRRAKIWLWAAGFYAFINGAGLIYAAIEGEEMHAMAHAFLLLMGLAGYLGWRLSRPKSGQSLPQLQEAEARIEYLQQSVDAMALELERVGEAQRFSDKLRVERGEISPLKKDQ